MTERKNEDQMTTAEAAEYIRYAEGTLEQWRCKGKGPVYLKRGRDVWYRKADLDRWKRQRFIVCKPKKVI